MTIVVNKCTDVYMYPLGDEVLEFECVRDLDKHTDVFHHLWKQTGSSKRCLRTMNHFRCDLWNDHGSGCHSRELMFELEK